MKLYFFYSKGGKTIAVEKDATVESDWLAQGYKKEFEEVQAESSQAALARFNDIRAEEEKTLWAFATGPTFFGGIALIGLIVYFIIT